MSVKATIEGKDVMRSYTPTTLESDLGHFDLVIKVHVLWQWCINCAQSYPTGTLSKWFASLKVGDTVNVKGPKGNFVYAPNAYRALGMIAGGTGITPMFQVIISVELT